jgi:hypothetical protein
VPVWLDELLTSRTTLNSACRAVETLLLIVLLVTIVMASIKAEARLGREVGIRTVFRSSRASQVLLLLWSLTVLVSLVTLSRTIAG